MAAKKAPAKKVEVAPQQEVVVKAPTKTQPAKPSWEIKDRTYILTSGRSPITFTIPGKHTLKHSLLYFDAERREQREIKYATNQSSPFADEQKGESTLGHIIFKNGTLFVPKEKQNLQKILSLYHPLKNKVYKELDQVEIAEDELDMLELQIEALNAAKNMDIDHENVQLRNFAIQATENKIIRLSDDQRYFTWASNGRKLMEVPFDENPYSAFAHFLKTDEGVEVYKSIDKKIN